MPIHIRSQAKGATYFFTVTLAHRQTPLLTENIQLLRQAFQRANAQRSNSKIKHREKGIWHRRYWEHQIKDQQDLQNHVDYIHYNPVKHGLVAQVKDWPYSSFHRYAQRNIYPENWGNSVKVNEGEVFGE